MVPTVGKVSQQTVDRGASYGLQTSSLAWRPIRPWPSPFLLAPRRWFRFEARGSRIPYKEAQTLGATDQGCANLGGAGG